MSLGSTTTSIGKLRRLRDQTLSAIKRSTGTSSRPMHPGAFVHASDSGLNFPSPEHLDQLLDYYDRLPEGARNSAKEEEAFSFFSFTDLPDRSYWTCDLNDADVRQITSNIKSAADALYGEAYSEESFDWGSVREQPKYAQLLMAGVILSKIGNDTDSIWTGKYTNWSSDFKNPKRFPLQNPRGTGKILNSLEFEAKTVLNRDSRWPPIPQCQTASYVTPSVPRSHGRVGTQASAGVLEHSEEYERVHRELLSTKARVVQNDVALLAHHIRHAVQLESARMTTAESARYPKHPSINSTGSYALDATNFRPAPSANPTSSVIAPHISAIPPPAHGGPLNVPCRTDNNGSYRYTPPATKAAHGGTGLRTLGYAAGTAAAAWAGYELYTRSQGTCLGEVARSMTSWWSGNDHPPPAG